MQRRYQIKAQAFYRLFKQFTAKIPLSNTMPIIAVDGSDVSIPRNPDDLGTAVTTRPENRPYNLVHINAFYNLTNGIYQDVLIQDKRDSDERDAFLRMMENSPFRTGLSYYG